MIFCCFINYDNVRSKNLDVYQLWAIFMVHIYCPELINIHIFTPNIIKIDELLKNNKKIKKCKQTSILPKTLFKLTIMSKSNKLHYFQNIELIFCKRWISSESMNFLSKNAFLALGYIRGKWLWPMVSTTNGQKNYWVLLRSEILSFPDCLILRNSFC